MQIQLNSDRSVAIDQSVSAEAQTILRAQLDRFADHLTRLEVHLSDVNGERGGAADKRCLLEARPSGRDPVIVTHDGPSIALATRGAAQKMSRLLTSLFGRLENKHA
jgi:hypothetical protein